MNANIIAPEQLLPSHRQVSKEKNGNKDALDAQIVRALAATSSSRTLSATADDRLDRGSAVAKCGRVATKKTIAIHRYGYKYVVARSTRRIGSLTNSSLL